MTQQQREQLQAWHTEAAAAFAARRCCRPGCKKPVFMVVIGSQRERAPGGFIVQRSIPDVNYCKRHAPGLRAEAVA
jgi:hypothetical protein